MMNAELKGICLSLIIPHSALFIIAFPSARLYAVVVNV